MKTFKQHVTEAKAIRWVGELMDAMEKKKVFDKYYEQGHHGDPDTFDDVPYELIRKHLSLLYTDLEAIDKKTVRSSPNNDGYIVFPYKRGKRPLVSIIGATNL